MTAFSTRYGRATLGEVMDSDVDDLAEFAHAVGELLREESPATPSED